MEDKKMNRNPYAHRWQQTKAFLAVVAIAGSMQGSIAQEKSPSQAIGEAKQGAIVQLPGLLTEQLPLVPYDKMVLPGPQLVMSDDPEYIRVPEAIALREKIQPGAVRLYVYNVNGVQEPQMDRKITALIKNLGTSDMHFRMLRHTAQRPSTNYYAIGKGGLFDYFTSTADKRVRKLRPGKAMPIDESLERLVAGYDELVHGIYEFVIDQPAEITVLQTDPNTSGLVALEKIKDGVLPNKHANAGRGVFGVANYRVTGRQTYDTKDGLAHLLVADGKEDPWVRGIDGSQNLVSELAGNYGVMYDIELKWKSSDGKGLALVTWNSRSGNNQWCGGMAASVKVSRGKFEEGVVQLPSDQLATKGAPEAVLIQVFPPAPDGAEQTIRLTYSPPGASCLPTPLVFIPIDLD